MGKSAYRMVVRRGPTPGLILELSKSDLTVGRDLSNDFVINDVEVSRKHLRLILVGEHYRVEDLGSTNGTFVNGQRLSGPHNLVPGELLSLGEHLPLVYEAVPYVRQRHRSVAHWGQQYDPYHRSCRISHRPSAR